MRCKVGIIGATGYAGAELVRWLCRHPAVELEVLYSQSYAGQRIDTVFPHLTGYVNHTCEEAAPAEVAERCAIIFTALPHGHAVAWARAAIEKGRRLIDLGADFRFRAPEVYEAWYKVEHTEPELSRRAVYGLPELYRQAIKDAPVVANPGCYPTASILALAPLVRERLIEPDSIVIDAKSGVSGAGRGLSLNTHFSEVTESIRAYNVAVHRHTPEIEQELSALAGEEIVVSFTPHLTPMVRGILSTCYARLRKAVMTDELLEIYRRFYAGEPFIRVLPAGQLPATKYVTGTNHCFIGLVVDRRTRRVVVVSAIDNLVKGAAGQAIQNMNIMLGLPEETGLLMPAMYP